MSAQVKQRDHVELVDYLRGLAAAMVAWFHLTNGYGDSWVTRTGSYGWLGVEIFFVISGFVITIALSRKTGPWRVRTFADFMVKRIIRLEPPYLASVALAIGLLFLSARAPGFNGPPPSVHGPQLLFHLAYLIPFTSYEWLQPIYWTLTYEFFFYIFAGLALPLMMAKGGRAIFVGAAVIAAAAVAAGVLPPLVLLFVLGIAASRYYLKRDAVWLTLAVALLATGPLALNGMATQAGVGLGAAALMALGRRMPLPPLPIARVLKGLGAISYSLYLVHVPIGGRLVNLGERWLHSPIEHLLLSILAFTVSCACAALFWWTIEAPAIRAAGRYARRTRRRDGTAAA